MFPEKRHSEALGDGTPSAIEHALHSKLNSYVRHPAIFAFHSACKGNINRWTLLLSRENCTM